MNPPVTFPCHFSMTHSVTPQRHGILTNTYVPRVRPVTGIFEKIQAAHGAQIPEDMTVPLFLYGPNFIPGKNVTQASLLDIAPTIAEVMGIDSDPDWEGTSLVNRKI